MRSASFVYDPELELELPEASPNEFRPETADAETLLRLERAAGLIPDRIRALEARYETLYRSALEQEGEAFYAAMDEAVAVARRIADLNVWYMRLTGQPITPYYG
ncbi:hypothetical protein AB1399_05580 [Hydrogenibacillus schlegelii]|uniref:Uncharacterized protein n=1 Tax=Hydrogenibacillus schlegelii TaxID=1484 RepID=A0A132N7E8_HYDSH|nr:hypothetical protein [Hydrogenibacillus schlegelii]KWX06048.1 hypothetical protein TR75_07130 [Hydrogenibacillus schlegelii]OAR04329.1 hypothetical protein SA87_05180 [Hydrogenibacillus schlegelii]